MGKNLSLETTKIVVISKGIGNFRWTIGIFFLCSDGTVVSIFFHSELF